MTASVPDQTTFAGAVGATTQARDLTPYVPRIVLDWLREAPQTRVRTLDGTMAFVDISGFTALSERLAVKGKLGAEEVTEVINATFERLLRVAYENGGGLLKFGGDALLLFYTGPDHAARACRAAHGMRATLNAIGQPRTSVGRVTLRLHAGVHSGPFDFFLVGDVHRELIVTGPHATTTVEMEATAEAGEIALSAATAGALDARCVGPAKGNGWLLKGAPSLESVGFEPIPSADGLDVISCVPVAVREHVSTGTVESEHRNAAVGFVRFSGVNGLLAEDPVAAADAVHELVTAVQRACLENGVAFLETDIDAEGGRIIVVAGAPQTAGDDEERLLRALRAVVEADLAVPVHCGASRGRVFAGQVGPPFRRTYTVLGSTAALAARLMARAGPQQILAPEDVLDRSGTIFAAERLAPLALKGKAEPVIAYAVGPPLARREPERLERLPLIGRQRELAILGAALTPVRMGFGSFVELVGEAGMGKSRIVEELRLQCPDLRVVAIACDPYAASTPYSAFRAPLLQLLAVDVNGHPAAENTAALAARLEEIAPELQPWIPLIGIPLDVDVLPTREVDELDPSFRRARLNGVLTTVLSRLLSEPTLLVFEDVHWMDEASSDVLRHVGSTVASRPWFVCATRRPVGGGFSAADGVPPIAALTLRLEALAPGEATSLVTAVAEAELSADDVNAIVERSGGNPLFLRELISRARRDEADPDELPETVEALVTARIDALPLVERTLLRWASVFGASFSAELVARVLEGDPTAALDSESWDRVAEFIERDPYVAGGFRFRHALIRDAAYEGLPFRRRRELHARVGEVYEALAGADPSQYAELLSLHFYRAQMHERAWRYSILAGRRAQAKWANVEAADFYHRAINSARHLPNLSRADIGAIWEALGDVSELAGRYEDAAVAYRNARRLLRGDAQALVALLLKEGRLRENSGAYSDALRWYRRGLELVEQVTDEHARRKHRVRLRLGHAAARFRQGAFNDAIESCHDVIAEAQGLRGFVDLEGLAHAYYLLHLAYTSLGSADRISFRGLALPIYEELGDLLGQANVLNNLGIDAYYEGRWAEALELYARSREYRERIGDVVGAAQILNNIAEIKSDQGHLVDAEEQFREVHRVCSGAGARLLTAVAVSNLGRVAARAGRLEEAVELLTEALQSFVDIKAASFALETEARLAECAVLATDYADALGRTDRILAEQGLPAVLVAAVERIRAYALLQARRPDDAAEALRRSLDAAESAGATYEIARTLEARSRLAAARGADGRDEAARARALLTELGAIEAEKPPLPL